MNRDAIFQSPIGRQAVATKAWGIIYVRGLQAKELPQLLEILEERGARRLARFCVLGCIKEDGAPLFLPGDEEQLMEMPLEPIAEIASAFLEFNGLDGIEEEKKSPSTPSITSFSEWRTGGESPNRRS